MSGLQDLPSSWRCPQCQVSKDEFQAVIEEVAGFAENQDYGVGFNTWTSGQKDWPSFSCLRSLYQRADNVAGEFAAFAEEYQRASQLLDKAVGLFKAEEDSKVQGLIQHCEELKVFCDAQPGVASVQG
eukprot:s4465_g4.t1